MRERELSNTLRPLWNGSRGQDNQCVRGKKIPHSTHNRWSLFFGWGPTRNGFSMACRASATCFLSGHVASVNLGESRKIRFRADQVDMSKVAYGIKDKSKLARDNQEAPRRYPGL